VYAQQILGAEFYGQGVLALTGTNGRQVGDHGGAPGPAERRNDSNHAHANSLFMGLWSSHLLG